MQLKDMERSVKEEDVYNTLLIINEMLCRGLPVPRRWTCISPTRPKYTDRGRENPAAISPR